MALSRARAVGWKLVSQRRLHISPGGTSIYAVPSTSSRDLNAFVPRIKVIGVGGAGCNVVNNLVANGSLDGVEFICANTDAQHLATCTSPTKIQLGRALTQGLGGGADHLVGRAAAEESRDEILDAIGDAHLVFIAAGMGGGTGTGAAPVIAEMCYEKKILTVAIVMKPFAFEGKHRMRIANEGIRALNERADAIVSLSNQNLFNLVSNDTSFVNAVKLADEMILDGVKAITDVIVKPGLINLDFADVQAVLAGMGATVVGTGVARGDNRAIQAAQFALNNPLLCGDGGSIKSAKGMIVNISGGSDVGLFEVDQAAQLITAELEDDHANVIFGASVDESLQGSIKVSIVATGVDLAVAQPKSNPA